MFRVLPLLKERFWFSWATWCALGLLGLVIGGWTGVILQGAVLLLLGLRGIFADRPAKRYRRLEAVAFPEGPEVVPFLPQLLIILTFPPFFLAMTVLFWRIGREFPELLPVTGWADALALAGDNVLHTQVFFDFFEIFHLHLASRPGGWVGPTIIFVSRLLLDLAFIELVFRVGRAAYYRARGLGRGEDKLALIQDALDVGDATQVQYQCEAVGGSLRDAVDALVAHVESNGAEADQAWRSLVTMREFALPYLERQFQAATGTERTRLGAWVDRLRSATALPPAPAVPRRLWPLALLAAGLVGGLVTAFLLPGFAGLGVGLAMLIVVGWLVIRARAWLDRLVRWGALRPFTPDRLARMIIAWVLLLAPLLVATAARVVALADQQAPGAFTSEIGDAVNLPSSLGYVFENLLHTQIFVDTLEIYHLKIAPVRTSGPAGYLLTFLTRIIFDLGIVAVVIALGSGWYNRVIRKFPVTPGAERTLRDEALECGPHADVLIGYHYREVRDFLVGRLRDHAGNAELALALSASGFLGDLQTAYAATGTPDAETAEKHFQLGSGLQNQGRTSEALVEFRRAQAIYDRLVSDGQRQYRAESTYARLGAGMVFLMQSRNAEALEEFREAVTTYQELIAEGRADLRSNLATTWQHAAHALRDLGRPDEGLALLRDGAVELFEQLVQENPQDVERRLELAGVYAELGATLNGQGQLEEAVAVFGKAITLREQLRTEFPDDQDILRGLANARGRLSNALADQGRREEACAEAQQAATIYADLVREGRLELRGTLATARSNLAGSFIDLGRFDEAMEEHRQAIALREALLREGRAEERSALGSSYLNLGECLQRQGRSADAADAEQRAIELYQRLVDEGQLEYRGALATAHDKLAHALVGQGRLDDAAGKFNCALTLYHQTEAEGHTRHRIFHASARQSLGEVRVRQKRWGEVERDMGAAIAIYEELAPSGGIEVAGRLARACESLGIALHYLGRRDEAIARLHRAVDLAEGIVRQGRRAGRALLASAREHLALVLGIANRPAEAFDEQRRALALWEELVAEGQTAAQARVEQARKNLAFHASRRDQGLKHTKS